MKMLRLLGTVLCICLAYGPTPGFGQRERSGAQRYESIRPAWRDNPPLLDAPDLSNSPAVIEPEPELQRVDPDVSAHVPQRIDPDAPRDILDRMRPKN